MSQLLDAMAGLPNASEPVPGLITGGLPQASHLAALQRAGGKVFLDARDPMEPRPFRIADATQAAGLEYVNIPMGHTRGADETLTRIRETLKASLDAAPPRPILFCCASGNRTAAALIPFLMLDRGLSEEDAVETAMRCGLRSAELMEWGVEYAKRLRG
jgi:protein tyrosine phosphatase (PTP) superfamily phosphohydrolase (DUF442 family)